MLIRSLLVPILTGVFCFDVEADEILDQGTYEVEFSDDGVLTRVPPNGLQTVDGERVVLSPSFAEWFGVRFLEGDQSREGVGIGRAPDWKGREQVEFVALHVDGNELTSVTRLGDLQVTGVYRFSETGPYLLGAVMLTNTSDATLRDVYYTREWRESGPGSVSDPGEGIEIRSWMLGDLAPGQNTGVGFSYEPVGKKAKPSVDVPLVFWTNVDYPNGLPVGATNGVSFGDYNGDGWIDIFACQSANLWKNVEGLTWEYAADLDDVLPSVIIRYGASFGDYNQDGLQDIATEPRDFQGQDSCLHLLKSLGNAEFEDVAIDPAIVQGQPCESDAETICWGDVNGDGYLDMFFPAYPEWAVLPGPGNAFLMNLGPTGEGGAFRFVEMVDEVGLGNPFLSARPEGAQFTDVDLDGDLDLYSNGTLYQNISTEELTKFSAMTEDSSGIRFFDQLEEGCAFLDYDMDGDQDLAMSYVSGFLGIVLWENRGDGTFFKTDESILENPFIGIALGLSTADWDNDGDIDFTTRQVFRRNMLMETGVRRFNVASVAIPGFHLTSAEPSWGDWDKDGDLDCALGNHLRDGTFYENDLYDDVPVDERRYVRIRPIRDSETVARGLEDVYGTTAELRVEGEGVRRRQFNASSAGYLNQNEYTMTFGLQPTAKGGGAGDTRFDVVVDFPGLESQGLWRVDRFINPVLGGIELDRLQSREITVSKAGRVRFEGCEFIPEPPRSPALSDPAPLVKPTVEQPLLPPARVSHPDTYVGLEIETAAARFPLRLGQLVFDGQLGDPVPIDGTEGNVLVWDITNRSNPELVREGVLSLRTINRNHRTHLPLELVLDPQRRYRIVAKVETLRTSPLSGPSAFRPLVAKGGFVYRDANPQSGVKMSEAALDPSEVYFTVRYREITEGAMTDLGQALAGTHGDPSLVIAGEPSPDGEVDLRLSGALEDANAFLITGSSVACEPFGGGIMVPVAELVLTGLKTDLQGKIQLQGTWPDLAEGIAYFFQFWIQDPGGIEGLAASNAVAVISL